MLLSARERSGPKNLQVSTDYVSAARLLLSHLTWYVSLLSCNNETSGTILAIVLQERNQSFRKLGTELSFDIF